MSKTKFTIFFSWQSDLKGNKRIIKDSLLAECQKQKEDNGYELEIDEATRNLPGSPKIEDAILEKISSADIFVCDITPVASCGRKLMPNSNVIFELGYALHALGDKRVILLAKNGDWDVNDMPFDFNHRRIGLFSSAKDCNLEFEIDCSLKYCANWSFSKIDWRKSYQRIDKLLNKLPLVVFSYKTNCKNQPIKATEESTVFFARRMAVAFPGVRGVCEFSDRKEINKLLSILLQAPLKFEQGLDKADTDPVWFFRAGAAEDIKSFLRIGNNKVLMNTDELLIKRIVVYRDSGRYYGQYVYVEVEEDKPCGCYSHNDDVIKSILDSQGYYDEEFAVFKPSWYLPERKITRQEYDDDSAIVNGKPMRLHGRAMLRLRYLTPYNFILAAKFSPFNSHEFDRTSEKYFKGMLNGSISVKQFNEYMMSFPKRDY